MDVLNREILEIVQCLECSMYLTSPIYHCIRDHVFCNTCAHRRRTCALCRNTLHRNFTLESITDLLKYPCPNVDEGCREFFKHENIEEHLITCSYREYACILGNDDEPCPWRGRRKVLEMHVLLKHVAKAWMQEDNTILWRTSCPDYEIQFVSALDECFYMHRKLIKSDTGDIMYWAMQYIGKSEDVIQFNYKIDLTTDEYKYRTQHYQEVCYDDLRDINEMIESGYCIAIPVSVLETYKNQDGDVIYQVKIVRNF